MSITYGEHKVLEACNTWQAALDRFDQKLDEINTKLDTFNKEQASEHNPFAGMTINEYGYLAPTPKE